MVFHAARGVACTLLLVACGVAGATGLQVAPTTLHLGSATGAKGLWLSNSGDQVLHAQVRVFRWTQQNGKDVLETSRGLVISPPMLELAAGARQLVRVIRTGAPPQTSEVAYRVLVDELPIATPDAGGVDFLLRYSIPVFSQSAGESTPVLEWSLEAGEDAVILHVANYGNGHAKLAGLSFVSAGGEQWNLAAGLLGYVLADSSMRWPLDAPFAAFAEGGTFHVRINGAPVSETVGRPSGAR